MDRSNKKALFHTNNSRGSISVYGNVSRPRSFKSHDHPKNDRNKKRNRYNKYFLPVILCLTNLTAIVPVTKAETVGGVSATASPVANSSGSVTNQAIQVLQGPYITNTYGGGIQCQGPTLNVTPFITGSASAAKPYEDSYDSPVYDMTADDDGVLINPGNILYRVPTRTGQKDNYSLSLGVSATWSNPLDKELQQQCKDAAAANIALMQQAHANKRLDFEIARLKNCGELMKAGISFHPKSPYYAVCADVVVRDVTYVKQHVHTIPAPSKSELPYSSDAADLGAPLKTQP